MNALVAVFAIGLVFLACCAASAEKPTGSVTKFGPEGKYRGYFVRPEGEGAVPGMVVIHEWWGLNDQVKSEADKLAKDGFAALAVDLFGKTTTDPKEAMQQVQELDQQKATAELVAAADYLRSLPYVPDDKVGSIGWCFGGGQSLNLALHDPKLATAVIYYGRPVTDPKELTKIKAAVLGIYGEADQSIPMAQVEEFKKALTEAGVRHEIHTYPGAGHAFANPTRGDAYRPEAAKDAWEKTKAFLQRYLKHS